MPIIQRPYVPPEDQVPQEDSFVNPGDTQSPQSQNGETAGEPITFWLCGNIPPGYPRDSWIRL